MKKGILILVATLFIACGKSDSKKPKNLSPDSPELTSPTNNQLCTSPTLVFTWTPATDPDGDSVSYQIVMSTSHLFDSNLKEYTSTTNIKTINLERETTYYWKVKAIDENDNEGLFSETFSFYTEGEGVTNYIPNTPQLLGPNPNAIVKGTASLSWSSSDADNDPLTYDVYVDTQNPPVNKVATNQSTTNFSYTPATNGEYFWKVVVKDGKGAEAISAVRSFTKE